MPHPGDASWSTSTPATKAELRRGRRYSVARRLAGLFASYARQRPQLLIDWLDGNAQGLDIDLRWQPDLWRALVDRVDADPPHVRHQKTSPGCTKDRSTCRHGCRCSGTPGCRAPRSNCCKPSPPTTTCTCGCRIPATLCGRSSPAATAQSPAATTPATAMSVIRCSRRSDATCASYSAACRRIRRPTNT